MDVAVYETSRPVVVYAEEGAAGDGATALGEMGVELYAVEGVDEAVEFLEATEVVDCVVTASTLVDGTGRELARTVRERDPDLPVVYLAAEPSVDDAAAATAAGAGVYLPRDRVESGELQERVDELVAGYDRRRQIDRERDMFRALMEESPMSIYFKDAAARHVCVSSSVLSATGETVLGRSDVEIHEAPGVEEGYRDDFAVVETGEPILEKQEHFVSTEGDDLWLRTTKLPWRDERGDVQGLVGVTRELTETLERERDLERQKRRLERFASFASHDLRRPVAAAERALERARTTDGPADPDALAEVDDALERLEGLTEHLLAMARPDATGSEVEWVPLADSVERAWDTVAPESATLELRVPPGLEISAEPDRLEHLFENLVLTAVQTAGGDVAISIAATDRGIRLWADEPWFGDGASDRETGSSPDGAESDLAFAREVAQSHGWTMDPERAADGRTRVEFEGCLFRSSAHRDAVGRDPVPITDHGDVGGATPPGEASRLDADGPSDGESWRIEGAGRNVWYDVCEFHGAWAEVEGDVRVQARVTSLEHVHEYSKAGVALFDPQDPDAPLAYLGRTPVHGTEVLSRPERGESIGTEQFRDHDDVPLYYRIDRIGDLVTHSVSETGAEWSVIDRRRFDAPAAVAAGLVVCSHSPHRLSEATFEDVRVQPLEVDR